MLAHLFRTRMFGHLSLMLYHSWSVNIARFMERQTGTTIEWFHVIPRDPVFI